MTRPRESLAYMVIAATTRLASYRRIPILHHKHDRAEPMRSLVWRDRLVGLSGHRWIVPHTLICRALCSGKSTQVPSFILEHDMRKGRNVKIFCTEVSHIPINDARMRLTFVNSLDAFRQSPSPNASLPSLVRGRTPAELATRSLVIRSALILPSRLRVVSSTPQLESSCACSKAASRCRTAHIS